MVTQSFMYNAISFTYPFVLTKFYAVPSHDIGYYILPFAFGNFLGPLLLGRFFDTIGRKQMISFTYAVAGACWRPPAISFGRAPLPPSLKRWPGHPYSFSRPPAPAPPI